MASGMRFGQYELGPRLAAGGMGEVFIARRRGAGSFEKELALKLLLPHLAEDPEFVTRFFDEARLAARMNHPNIVPIFDVGEADGRPYLAMALVEGVSLATLLRELGARREPLPLPMVRLVATGLLEALAHAHGLTDAGGQSLGVIHRDVSPSNVLVSTAGAVFLNDFGLAKASTNLHATRPGTLRGKVAYVAPEQLERRGPVTRQADVFSAGATLYQLLTLVSPFWRPSDVATMEAVLREAPRPAGELRPDASAAIAAALERAMAKAPEARFPSARAFREAFVDGPVASAPELGEYVASRCPEALAAFGRRPGAASSSSVPRGDASTSSLPEPPAPAPSAPSVPRWRWWPAALLALGLVGGLAGLLALRGGNRPAEVVADAEAASEAVVPESSVPESSVAVEREPAVTSLDGGEPDAVPERPEVARRRRPRPPHSLEPSPQRPPAVESVRVGYLTADARPWAAVLLDGREVERTPLSRFPVPVGTHQLVLLGPAGQREVRELKVTEGQVVTVQADFTAR